MKNQLRKFKAELERIDITCIQSIIQTAPLARDAGHAATLATAEAAANKLEAFYNGHEPFCVNRGMDLEGCNMCDWSVPDLSGVTIGQIAGELLRRVCDEQLKGIDRALLANAQAALAAYCKVNGLI